MSMMQELLVVVEVVVKEQSADYEEARTRLELIPLEESNQTVAYYYLSREFGYWLE